MRNSPKNAFTLIEVVVVIAIIAVLSTLLLPVLAKAKARDHRLQCTYNLKQVGVAFRLWAADHGDRYPIAVSAGAGGVADYTSGFLSGPAAGANMWHIFQVLSNQLNDPKLLTCPTDERVPATNFLHLPTPGIADFKDNTHISYALGRDAQQIRPQMILTADRNIAGPTVDSANNGYGNSPSNAYSLGTNPVNTAVVWTTTRMHQGEGNVGLTDGSVQQFTSAGLRKQLSLTADFSPAYNGGYPGGNVLLFP